MIFGPFYLPFIPYHSAEIRRKEWKRPNLPVFRTWRTVSPASRQIDWHGWTPSGITPDATIQSHHGCRIPRGPSA